MRFWMEIVARLAESRVDGGGGVVPGEAAIFAIEGVGQVDHSISNASQVASLSQLPDGGSRVERQRFAQDGQLHRIGIAGRASPDTSAQTSNSCQHNPLSRGDRAKHLGNVPSRYRTGTGANIAELLVLTNAKRDEVLARPFLESFGIVVRQPVDIVNRLRERTLSQT